MEKWIPGYVNLYSLTEEGDVISYKYNRKKHLTLQILSKGYLGVSKSSIARVCTYKNWSHTH